jgi:putative transposase
MLREIRRMPRRSVSRVDMPCCYHVTHRCQERRFLLRFKQDRRQYLARLREALHKWSVSVLNYMVTSNHVHLLFWAESPAQVSAVMQYVAGAAAQDYNRRKGREGAFWRGRFRPTLVQSGTHLSRCFFYIDLNMVRAGVVSHPSEWEGGAYAELTRPPKRRRLIDRVRLFQCLECVTEPQFTEWYEATLRQECARGYRVRESYWTEAAAVGGRDWVETLASSFPTSWRTVEPVQPDHQGQNVAESAGTYVLRLSGRHREGMLDVLGR